MIAWNSGRTSQEDTTRFGYFSSRVNLDFVLPVIIGTILVKMKENLGNWIYSGRRFSRRNFLRAPAEIAAAITATNVAIKIEKLISPKHEKFGYLEKIDDETHQMLRQFRPITVAHNGADDFGRLRMSIDAGVDYAEADVRQFFGRLRIIHGENLGYLLYDGIRREAGFSGTVPYFEELVQEIKPSNQKLFLELKEDSFNLADKVIRAVNNNGLEDGTAFFAVGWHVLDRIYQKTGKNTHLFYTIGDIDQLQLFLDQQMQYQRQGVSLNVDLATKEVVGKLHESGAVVLVAVVKKAKQAVDVLNAGADGLISGNLRVLSIWGKREPHPSYV